MNFNIVTAIEKRMGFSPFEKMDPNYKGDRPGFPTNVPGSENYSSHYAQAATMAVLAGLYRNASDREGASAVLNPGATDLLNWIFRGREDSIVREVADYLPGKSGVENRFTDDVKGFMRQILDTAIGLLREQVPEKKDEPAQIQKILAGQRHNILAYLPADIMAGRALEDNSMDDRTNKMEGPVSGLMHFIENVFAEKE